jgi:hypothetical protein
MLISIGPSRSILGESILQLNQKDREEEEDEKQKGEIIKNEETVSGFHYLLSFAQSYLGNIGGEFDLKR